MPRMARQSRSARRLQAGKSHFRYQQNGQAETARPFCCHREAAAGRGSYRFLFANSSFMALNLSLPISALKAQTIEKAKITTGRTQKMILTASCAV